MPNLPKDKCINDIIADSGNVLSKKQAKDILDEIISMHEGAKKGGEGVLPKDYIDAFAQKRIRETKLGILQKQRESLLNARAKKSFLDYVKKWPNKAEGVMAYLGGKMDLKPGARISVDSMIRSIQNEYTNLIVDGLEKAGLMKAASSGKIERDIARAMWGMDASPQAKKIAEILKGAYGKAIARLNNAGGYTKMLPEYVFRQSHDRDLIRKAGKDAWKAKIREKLDYRRTFIDGNVMDAEKFLDDAYDALISGIHLRPDDGVESGFAVGSNLGKRMGAHRKLHFKDADAFMDYHQEFGSGNLMENVFYGLNNTAKQIGLMENLGVNPRANYDAIMKSLIEENRSDAKFMKTVEGVMENPENLAGYLFGELSSPKNHTLAKWSSTIRTVQSMSKLGMAGISALTDLANTASGLMFRNKGLVNSYFEPLRALFESFGDNGKMQRDIARRLGIVTEALNGEIHAALDVQEGLTKHNLNRLQNKFFKFTGLNWWTDSLKSGVAKMLSMDLADVSGKSFDDVVKDIGKQREFTKYGITKEIWDAWRSGVTEVDGNKLLFPDSIRKADLSIIDKMLNDQGITPTGGAREQLYNKLETQLRSYFVDSADELVLTPGAREKAILSFGTQAGTATGEVARFFAQFKAFPTTYMTKAFGREASYDSKTTSALAFTHLIAASTVLGYVAMTTKDYLKGKSPKPVFDADTFLNPKTLAAAMVQGGGAGIFTDAIFANYGYGRSFLSSMAGPVLGQADDLQKLYSKAVRGEDVASELINFGKANIPFYNLPTKPILDYLFIYGLQEHFNPGYLNRMEQSTRRNNGQEFALPPSDYAIQFK